MKVIQIQADINQKIIHPGDITVKRNEKVVWSAEDFDFEVFFDPNLNNQNPEHPFKTAPPNPPPGHVTAKAGEFHTRHVRPGGGAGMIPDGTRYKYNIIIKMPGVPGALDELDPDLIVEGDK